MRSFLFFLALLGVLSTTSAVAAVQIEGKTVPCCSGYWSRTDAVWRISYVNADLPWGTTVLVRHGLQRSWGEAASEDWTAIDTMQAVPTAPYTWSVTVSREVASRGGPAGTALQFAVMLIYPDGSVAWDKGSSSAFGYYEAATVACRASTNSDDFCAGVVEAVVRD
jgi:hypothetical protein